MTGEHEPADADPGLPQRPRPGDLHPAVFASNWRTVLAVDAAMGLAVLAAGVVLALVWNPLAGGALGSLGIVYVALVVRRGRRWARLRRDAGL